MKCTGLFAVLLTVGGTAAFSQNALEPVLERLRDQGFTGIEIKREAGKIHVEGQRSGFERELVYDASTGRLLKDEFQPVSDGSRADFLRGGTGGGAGSVAAGTSATAAATAGLDPVISKLRADGFSSFEVKRERGQIKVEAYRDGFGREMVYDAATGALIKDELQRDRDRNRDNGRYDVSADDRDDDSDHNDRANRGEDHSGGGRDNSDDGDRSNSRDDDDHDDRGGDRGSDRDDDDRSSGRGSGNRGGDRHGDDD